MQFVQVLRQSPGGFNPVLPFIDAASNPGWGRVGEVTSDDRPDVVIPHQADSPEGKADRGPFVMCEGGQENAYRVFHQ
jgi:hypothetical protein